MGLGYCPYCRVERTMHRINYRPSNETHILGCVGLVCGYSCCCCIFPYLCEMRFKYEIICDGCHATIDRGIT